VIRIGVTGHRPKKLGGYDRDNSLRRALRARFAELALCIVGEHLLATGDARAEVFSGMAQGFDQDVACACIRANIPFVACVPFAGQERRWTLAAQDDYAAILSRAERVTRGCDREPRSKAEAVSLLQARNEFIVDNSDVLVACWDGSSGGTSHCVSYASRRRKRILCIDPTDFAEWRDWQQREAETFEAHRAELERRRRVDKPDLVVSFGDKS
jgi:uncharacterized phage-like protein YoqJ